MDEPINECILIVSENPLTISTISAILGNSSIRCRTISFAEIQSDSFTLDPNSTAIIIDCDNYTLHPHIIDLRYPNRCNALLIGWTDTPSRYPPYDTVLAASTPISECIKIIEESAASNRLIRALPYGSHKTSIAQTIRRLNQNAIIKNSPAIKSPVLHDNQLILYEILSNESGLKLFKDFLTTQTSMQPITKVVPEILLVEDEDEICEMTQEYFQGNGLTIRTATTLSKAKQVIDDHPTLDIIFLDYSLPDGNGILLLRELMSGLKSKTAPPESFPRLLYPDIVINSAYTDQETIDQCIAAGATAYMPKPVSLKSMVEMSNQLFERRNLLNEIQQLASHILKVKE